MRGIIKKASHRKALKTWENFIGRQEKNLYSENLPKKKQRSRRKKSRRRSDRWGTWGV
jgi:hypothetical protein